MPVYSMTGYASASSQPSTLSENTGVSNPISHAAHVGLTVELRSVNGRFLDLGFRMPEDLRGLEPALRELLTGKLKRGKVELRINTQRDSEGSWPQPQADQLNRLSRLEGTVQNWLPKAQPLSVHEALQWCKGGGAATEKLDEPAMEAARRCVDGLLEAREREGEKLVAILMERVAKLRELADAAEPMLPAIVQRQQQRFLERWQEALASTGAAQTIPEDNLFISNY